MLKPRSFVHGMPADTLSEFEEEIRRFGYGQSERLVEWLQERGVKSSRSSVARYELALKEADGVSGSAGSMKAVANAKAASLDTLNGLYRRLGELEYERETILGIIRDRMAEEFEAGAQ